MTADQLCQAPIVGERLLGRPVRAVARLAGGQHAVTTIIEDGYDQFVLRQFPPNDPAVDREIAVLRQLRELSDIVPGLVAYDLDEPCIVTNCLPGGPPNADLSLDLVALGMAATLARIHALSGSGLRSIPLSVPHGGSVIERSPLVLAHFDYWCGNALWEGAELTGVVDWSGAGRAPRGLDVSWCRLDLVLLGSPAAADIFLTEYRERSGDGVAAAEAWDRRAASLAAGVVETWAPNYAGIGRADLTAEVLRQRFDDWCQRLGPAPQP